MLTEAILHAITKTTEGDKRLANRIREKYWQVNKLNRDKFVMLLERYFRGDRLRGRHWNGGYVFAAPRTWKIKNEEQLNKALKVEDRYFKKVLEQYFRWFRSKVIKLPKEDEISLKEMFSHSYSSFTRS